MTPVMALLLRKRRAHSHMGIFMDSISSLLSDYRCNESSFAKYFGFLLLIRRVIFIGNIVLLYNYPFYNLFFLIFQGAVMIGLTIKYQPFKMKGMNRFLIAEETGFGIVNIFLLICLKNNFDEETEKDLGIFLIALSGSIIVAQLVIALYDAIVVVKKFIISLRDKSKSTDKKIIIRS